MNKILSSEITAYSSYINRRKFIKSTTAISITSSLSFASNASHNDNSLQYNDKLDEGDELNTFEEINQVRIPYVYGHRREGDLESVIADNKLAKEILNWTPQKDLADMCRDGWNWVRNIEL